MKILIIVIHHGFAGFGLGFRAVAAVRRGFVPLVGKVFLAVAASPTVNFALSAEGETVAVAAAAVKLLGSAAKS